MAALDPQTHIAMLERQLQWAQLRIQSLEERWRQHLIRLYGPKSETLGDLQLALLEEEPSVTRDEVDAESRREQLPPQPPRERQPHPGRKPLPESLPRIEQVIAGAEPNCKTCGAETSLIGYDASEVLDYEPARWLVRVTKREKRACGKCSTVAMPELAPRIVEKGLASDRVVIHTFAGAKVRASSWVSGKGYCKPTAIRSTTMSADPRWCMWGVGRMRAANLWMQ